MRDAGLTCVSKAARGGVTDVPVGLGACQPTTEASLTELMWLFYTIPCQQATIRSCAPAPLPASCRVFAL